jgi:hypothetical protein
MNFSGNAGEKPCELFGGTKLDAAVISIFPTALGIEKSDPHPILGKGPESLYLACMGLVDLPFSLVADTLALPVTVPAHIKRATESQPPPDSAPGIGVQSVPN